MRQYSFTSEEIGLIHKLLSRPVKRILYGVVYFLFEFDDSAILLKCEDMPADSINKSDEAIVARLELLPLNSKYSGQGDIVAENKSIDRAWMVNTMLTFTPYQKNTLEALAALKADYEQTKAATGVDDLFKKALATTIGGYDEVICHPNSEQARSLDPANANLLTVGLLLQIEGRYLRAFIPDNAYGFGIFANNFFIPQEEIAEWSNYEFVGL